MMGREPDQITKGGKRKLKLRGKRLCNAGENKTSDLYHWRAGDCGIEGGVHRGGKGQRRMNLKGGKYWKHWGRCGSFRRFIVLALLRER